MENHEASRHPGPWRVMRADSEFAGLLIAVGFLVMGFVSMPIASVFVIGGIALGVVVALLLRFIPRKLSRSITAALVILAAFVTWWLAHNPRRPHTVASDALYLLPNNVPGRLHNAGYWLECWFDRHDNVDRCRLTDEHGTVSFEDVFLQCEHCTPLPQDELVFRWPTGRAWIQSCDKRVNAPIVYVKYDQRLVPQSLYAEARRETHCPSD